MFVDEGSTILTLLENHVISKEYNIQCSHEYDIINISQINSNKMMWFNFQKGP